MLDAQLVLPSAFVIVGGITYGQWHTGGGQRKHTRLERGPVWGNAKEFH